MAVAEILNFDDGIPRDETLPTDALVRIVELIEQQYPEPLSLQQKQDIAAKYQAGKVIFQMQSERGII